MPLGISTQPFQYLITDIVPLGTILPWCKSLTGTPALATDIWVECNGQTISDATSVFDGVALPNLNGGTHRMVRGAATSGGTGGSDTNSHTHTVNRGGAESDNGPLTCAATGTVTSSAPSDTSNVPAYYEVVWVIKVK